MVCTLKLCYLYRYDVRGVWHGSHGNAGRWTCALHTGPAHWPPPQRIAAGEESADKESPRIEFGFNETRRV